MFGSAESSILDGLGTEQVRHVLRTAPSIGIICGSDARAANMFRTVSKIEDLSLTYRIAWFVFQRHLGDGGPKSVFTNVLGAATAFKTLFFVHSTVSCS